MSEKHILVGQSGGPTAAINASLAGVIAQAREAGCRVTGMRHGIQGFLAGRTVDLAQALPDEGALALLLRTPASWLGSCRFKLPSLDDMAFYDDAFARLEQAGIDAVLYIGGNDSMDTIAKLGAHGRRAGSPIRFIGVPKTIDNDLVGTDHTPGYGSAAKFVATATGELFRDADVYDLKSVTFVEIMGRDAGWLAGAAALDVDGVTGLSGGTMSEQILGRKKLSKGITILWESDNITINVSIQIRYGGIIPEIAKKVQEAIISSVEDTSGLKVAAVNVRVGGVTFEKPED